MRDKHKILFDIVKMAPAAINNMHVPSNCIVVLVDGS